MFVIYPSFFYFFFLFFLFFLFFFFLFFFFLFQLIIPYFFSPSPPLPFAVTHWYYSTDDKVMWNFKRNVLLTTWFIYENIKTTAWTRASETSDMRKGTLPPEPPSSSSTFPTLLGWYGISGEQTERKKDTIEITRWTPFSACLYSGVSVLVYVLL